MSQAQSETEEQQQQQQQPRLQAGGGQSHVTIYNVMSGPSKGQDQSWRNLPITGLAHDSQSQKTLTQKKPNQASETKLQQQSSAGALAAAVAAVRCDRMVMKLAKEGQGTSEDSLEFGGKQRTRQ